MSNENQKLSCWTTPEFEKLVELVKPHAFLYHDPDPSRKNILARESTWELIASELCKPVEECKKRWKALRDGYMKHVSQGENWNKPRLGVFKQLEFLTESDTQEEMGSEVTDLEGLPVSREDAEQVITDNQEYYEITLVENPQDVRNSMSNILIPQLSTEKPPKKIGRKNCGRKKSMLKPVGLTPIKILPKPSLWDGANIMQYVNEQPQTQVIQSQPKISPLKPAQSVQPKSEILDSLIEKILKEHTNEVDVFFRSMAASVKKLQPNLIPKVKMEVCNVIAKYEMQSFEKNSNSA